MKNRLVMFVTTALLLSGALARAAAKQSEATTPHEVKVTVDTQKTFAPVSR
jgi:hypothetical protein